MKAMKVIVGLVAIFVVMPIWYYLLYKLLQAANASDLMWFLYLVYLPAAIFVQTLTKIAESIDD